MSAKDDGHKHHPKHLQLGLDPDNLPVSSRKEMTKAEKDAAWADATTVEQFKIDIEELARGSQH